MGNANPSGSCEERPSSCAGTPENVGYSVNKVPDDGVQHWAETNVMQEHTTDMTYETRFMLALLGEEMRNGMGAGQNAVRSIRPTTPRFTAAG
jgi:hypothetical protein